MGITTEETPGPKMIEAGELVAECPDCDGQDWNIIMATTKVVAAYRCVGCGNEVAVKQNAH